ncbi:MAG: DUF3638 domain-containing protein [Verrucomicrobia bacterium]|nr:DUF3638 domain-containing protein [Verrucomicrobiota bacterium]
MALAPPITATSPPLLASSTSFLGKNRKILQLSPSLQKTDPLSRLARRIVRLVKQILSYLYPFQKINYTGLLGAFDRSSAGQAINLTTLNRREAFSYFKEKSKGDTDVAKAFGKHLDTAERELKLLEAFQATPYSKKKDWETLRGTINARLKDLSLLKEGESRLVVAREGEEHDFALCLFTKTKEGLSLKVMGRGPIMLTLGGESKKEYDGEAEIHTVWNYRNIDPSKMETLLKHLEAPEKLDPYKRYEKEEDRPKPPPTLAEGLAPLKEFLEAHKASPTKTKTANFVKSLKTLLEETNRVAGYEAHSAKRAMLRMEAGVLFEMVKEHGETATADSPEIPIMEALARTVSRDTLRAHKRGILSEADLAEITKEMAVVQRLLDKVEASAKGASHPPSKMPSDKPTGAITANATRAPSIALPEKVKEPSLREATALPPSDRVFTQTALEGDEAVLEALEKLSPETASPYKIIELASKLMFDETFRYIEGKRVPAPFWGSATMRERAAPLMEKLHALSKRVVKGLERKNHRLPKEAGPAIEQMGSIILFLEEYFFQDGLPLNASLSMRIKSYYESCPLVDQEKPLRKAFYRSFGINRWYNKKNPPSKETKTLPVVFAQAQLTKAFELAFTGTDSYDAHADGHPLAHGWTALLPPSLLGGSKHLDIGSQGGYIETITDTSYSKCWRDGYSSRGYRDTPEAIAHDPEGTLKLFDWEHQGEAWHSAVQATFERGVTPFNPYDSLWNGRRKLSAEEQTRSKTLLAHHTGYMARALIEKKRHLFAKEDLTDLLFLAGGPPSEFLAFFENHDTLLKDEAIETFVYQVFFRQSQIDTLFDALWTTPSSSANSVPREELPKTFAKKIRESLAKIEIDAEEMRSLLFWIRMSEKLRGIYKQRGISTEAFFDFKNALPRLRQAEKEASFTPYAKAIKVAALCHLLEKPSFTEEDVCTLVIDMQEVSQHSGIPVPPDILAYLERKYHLWMDAVSNGGGLSREALSHILDQVCLQKGYSLTTSPWEGSFPAFTNGTHAINLLDRSLEAREGGSTALLPPAIYAHPLFLSHFPDIVSEPVFMTKKDLTETHRLYAFKDKQGNYCQIEDKNGSYAFYRTMPEISDEPLQAVSFEGAAQHEDLFASLFNQLRLAPVESGLKGYAKQALAVAKKIRDHFRKSPRLPAILPKTLFRDPKDPNTLYAVSDAGKALFRIHGKGGALGWTATTVSDLRGEMAVPARQICSGHEIDHPIMKMVAAIENPSQIVVWGAKDAVEEIELVRYGLTFARRGNSFVSKEYPGYVLKASSLKERKGIGASLLLVPTEAGRPNKLLLAPQSSTSLKLQPNLPKGLAFVIYFLQAAWDMTHTNNPYTPARTHLVFGSSAEKLSATVVDIQAHTGEILYPQGDQVATRLEVISHLMYMGHYEEAGAALDGITALEASPAITKELFLFLSKGRFFDPPYTAALALKVANELWKRIGGSKAREHKKRQLSGMLLELLKGYLPEERKLPPSLRISPEDLKGIMAFVEEQETPESYNTLPDYTPPVEVTAGVPYFGVKKLEEELAVGKALTDADLKTALSLTPSGPPRLFAKEALGKYLLPDGLLPPSEKAQKAFIKEVLDPKIATLRAEKEKRRTEITTALTISTDPLEQLEILAKTKAMASFSDLAVALLQDNFTALAEKSLLPKGVDPLALKESVIAYFTVEVALQHASSCRRELLQGENGAKQRVGLLVTEPWPYDVAKHPEFLCFEAFHALTFRGQGLTSQLALLERMVGNPSTIIQAGTGSGKSAVLTVLRALLAANGKTLVTLQVLPHLYDEALAILNHRLENTFKAKVFTLRFNLSMPLQTDGVSLFKSWYKQLLDTIKERGCVLTDYKSLPLLEEIFINFSRQIKGLKGQGAEIDPLLLSHWKYLQKTLNLLQNTERRMMDEFDEPSNPKHRIQLQIGGAAPLPLFMVKTAMEVYDLLKEDPSLGLAQNLQGEMPEAVRKAALKTLATTLAKKHAKGDASLNELLLAYFEGESEAVLAKLDGFSDEEKDVIALVKDLITTYLGLTLSQSGKTRYQLSDDAAAIIPCVSGEPRKGSKFGNMVEDVCYLTQHYHQYGTPELRFKDWIYQQAAEWRKTPPNSEERRAAEERFHEIIPDGSLDVYGRMAKDELDKVINKLFPIHARRLMPFFLERHLHDLSSGGYVASMTPQDAAAMSRETSGVSATVGSLHAVKDGIAVDRDEATRIQAEMVARLKRRADPKVLGYDPRTPFALFDTLTTNKTGFSVLIDGSGAFREYNPQDVAAYMMSKNLRLKKVSFYRLDGSVGFVGSAGASLEESGFYFPQAQTRGSDQVFPKDAVAVLTVNEKDTMETFSQQEGRMRGFYQKIILASSSLAPSLTTVDAIVERKLKNQQEQERIDCFRAQPQKLQHLLREFAKRALLQEADLDRFLPLFDRFERLLISTPRSYEKSGSYFQANRAIVRAEADPVAELHALRDRLIGEVEREFRDLSPEPLLAALRAVDFTSLQSHLPEKVATMTVDSDEGQLEVEQEQMQEKEAEQESETTLTLQTNDKRDKVTSYLPHPKSATTHGVAALLKDTSFDRRLHVSEPFLPQERTDPIHKRVLFDDRMHRVGRITVCFERYPSTPSRKITKVTIRDVLEDRGLRWHSPSHGTYDFTYDIRTEKVLQQDILDCIPQIVASRDFIGLVAELKFLDGQIEGYTAEELQTLAEKGFNTWEKERLFMDKVLRHRAPVRDKYHKSQLEKWFRSAEVARRREAIQRAQTLHRAPLMGDVEGAIPVGAS